MHLFSYKVVYDIGFAPNPFHGVCTLATCKPRIRKNADVGDWVLGVGSAAQGALGQLVYAMEVGEKLTFDDYWNDARFQRKKADRRGSLKYRYGDNVYHQAVNGEWLQSDCRHSLETGEPNADHVKRDTSADAVLVASRFTYWGGKGPRLPKEFTDWNGVNLGDPGRDHTYKAYSRELIDAFVAWVAQLQAGYQAPPADW